MSTPLSLLLAHKGAQVAMISPEESVAVAVHLMNELHIGALLVTDDERRPVGIFTERDLLRRVVGESLDLMATPVGKVMTTEVATASPTTSVDDAMQLFMERRIRHLPVLDDGRLAGLISIGDVNRWMLSEREQEARQLRCYIQGDPACPV